MYGEATILVSGIGNYKGSQNIKFKITPKDINEINIQEIAEQKYTGEEIKPDITVTNGSSKLIENKDYTISYKNNINVGMAEIELIGKGNYKGTKTIQFKIVENDQNKPKDISKLEITGLEDKIYTGKLITPEIRIKDGETVLVKNVDYNLSYKNNINVGKGIITITGIGAYTGTIEREFNIEQKNIKNTLISDIDAQIYDGNKKEPEIIISSDGIILKKDEDYNLTYENNTKEGTATIKIQGIGNYTGTTTKTFNIVKNQDNGDNNNDNNNNNNNNNGNNNKDNSENKQNKINQVKNQDKTTANKLLPSTGGKTVIIVIIATCIFGVISYILYKKHQI